MNYSESEIADLLQRLADMTAERDAFKSAAIQATASALAAETLGDRDFSAIFSSRLGASLTDQGHVDVHPIGTDGRAIKRWDSERKELVNVGFNVLTKELKSKWQALPWLPADEPSPVERKKEPAGEGNLTEKMRRQREAERTAVTQPLSEAERQRARASNPWRHETFNLTETMRIERRDPAFAKVLKEAAGVPA